MFATYRPSFYSDGTQKDNRQLRSTLSTDQERDRRTACSIVSFYASVLFQAKRSLHNDLHALVGAICRSAGIFTANDLETWRKVHGNANSKLNLPEVIPISQPSQTLSSDAGGQPLPSSNGRE
jgi:hypothetical protein